jgi:prepilin peptidase CpaA
MNTPLAPVPVVVVLLASAIAAFSDIRAFRIPNRLTLPLLATGLLYHLLTGGVAGLWGSFLGAAFGFGALIVFYALGGLCAGDVKLMAAVGAWLGFRVTLSVFLVSSLATGLYAIVLVIVSRRWSELWADFQMLWIRLGSFGLAPQEEAKRVQAVVQRTDRRLRAVPFAAMVAVGLIVTLARI